MCMSLVAEYLLKGIRNTVAVVDTTGNFDVLKLYVALFARLRDDPGLLERFLQGTDGAARSAEDVAAALLERVRIMRAFDLVGVMEAVGEVRDELEGRKPHPTEVLPTNDEPAEEPPKGGRDTMNQPLEDPPKEQDVEKQKEIPKRTFVADSDDEDELLFDDEPVATGTSSLTPLEDLPPIDEDEILFVDGADDRIIVSSPPWESPLESPEGETPQHNPPEADAPLKKPTFLLIDNLAHVISPLTKKDYTRGNYIRRDYTFRRSTTDDEQRTH